MTSIQAHAHIIKKYRRLYSKQAGRMLIEYFSTSRFNKMIAEIPEIYPNVYFFTKGLGFTDEGVNRKSYTKNGEIIDQKRLGITKEEAIEWLNSIQ